MHEEENADKYENSLKVLRFDTKPIAWTMDSMQ